MTNRSVPQIISQTAMLDFPAPLRRSEILRFGNSGEAERGDARQPRRFDEPMHCRTDISR